MIVRRFVCVFACLLDCLANNAGQPNSLQFDCRRKGQNGDQSKLEAGMGA